MKNSKLISKFLGIAMVCIILVSMWSIVPTTSVGTTEAWVSRYDGPSGGMDAALAIAVDAQGNVYVTGMSMSGGTSENDYHYATIKYDTDGDQVWVSRYDGGGNQCDGAKAIAIDGSGNVYVTGVSSRPGSAMGVTDCATLKYDANGNQLWVARYDGGGGHSSNGAYAIVVDSVGNVYITGDSGEDWATIKYDSNGNQLWVARYDGPGHGGDDACELVVDGQGNIYVSGTVYGGSMTSFDHATVKYDTNGDQLWANIYDGPAHAEEVGGHIALDSLDNVYVSFYSFDTALNPEYVTVKYDTNGDQLWVARYDRGMVQDMAVDVSGNVYVTGYRCTPPYTNDYVTLKYDTNGNQCWVARYDGPASGEDIPQAIVADAFGNVYVTGFSQGNIADAGDYATIKYDSNGNMLWVARYNGPGNGSDTATAISLDGAQNVYVTGVSLGVSSFDYATISASFALVGNTPVGSPTVDLGVAVVKFDNVTIAGDTTATTSQGNPAGGIPSGFRVRGYFIDISTTASYTGNVTVGIRYDASPVANPQLLKLFHWEGNRWVDVTDHVDTANNIIWGQVADLSPFFVGDPAVSVGGIVEFPVGGSDSSSPPYAGIIGGIMAALAALALGGWFARRRWLGRCS